MMSYTLDIRLKRILKVKIFQGMYTEAVKKKVSGMKTS